MTIRKILVYPEDVLKKKVALVTEFDETLKVLVDDMAETMYAAPGVGLAANQIGVELSICVIDITEPSEGTDLHVFVNPEIVHREGEIVWEEGCLSFPDVLVDVNRSAHVRVKALDAAGVPFEMEAEGLLAVAVQHELDRLNGVTLADKVGFLRKKLMLKDLRRLKADQL